jgi:hypothetical protein
MATKSTRSFLISSLLLALLLTYFPAPVQAREETSLPTLDEFIEEVRNGKPGVLRGVYIPGVLANWVTQQPSDKPGFVSSVDDALTQFQLASRFGSTGLLAHNYLAGEGFSHLAEGQVLYLIYGNGKTETFVITHFMRFQALQPNSLMSDFVDLKDGTHLTASQLLSKAYNRPGQVVFQTCISADGNDSWGRLFVIAKPFDVGYSIATYHGA